MTTLVRPKCNLRSLLSFTARAFAAMPAAAIAYPDHCEWRVAKKFPLAPDSRREPHRVPLTTPSPCYMPRRDAMSATLANRQCLSLNGEPAEPSFSSAGGLVQFVAVSAAPMPYARAACLQRRK
jgi:hypothetical protein